MCKHEKVVFAGNQETLNPNKSIMLFRCLICSSTVTLNNKISKVEIVLEEDKIKLPENNIKNFT